MFDAAGGERSVGGGVNFLQFKDNLSEYLFSAVSFSLLKALEIGIES